MNETIVITGAGGVLCSAFAEDLAKTGAPVALLDRNLEAAEAVAAGIRAAGGRARAYRTDVLDRAALEQTHGEVLRDLGPCRVLLNGAGGNNPRATTEHEIFEPGDELASDWKTFFNLEPEGFDFVFRLNLMGTLLPTQIFAKDMLGQEGCCILNISSMNAYRPLTKIPAYSGAKAAVSNFTQWLAVHFSKEGIRVNAIAPGFFVSEQNERLLYNEDGTPTARAQKILAGTPAGRMGRPEELEGALLFLVNNEAAGFINGVVLPVDGGFQAYSGV